MGDFNLIKANIEDALGAPVLTVGSGSTLNTSGARTTNLYDHVLIFSQAATQELIGSPEVLDVRDVATSPAVFYQAVSDHLPIRAQFRSGPDDD